jgi:hypothetical protein
MHVICKSCSSKINVSHRPDGTTGLSGVKPRGNVHISGGKIGFGPGGSISFGSGGSVSFGASQPSKFICMSCGSSALYSAAEIQD